MAAFNYPAAVAFGAAKAGLGGSGSSGAVGYTVFDAAGVRQIARTSQNVFERGDASGSSNTGLYEATISLDTSWSGPALRIIWDIVGQPTVAAEETVFTTLQTITNIFNNVNSLSGAVFSLVQPFYVNYRP